MYTWSTDETCRDVVIKCLYWGLWEVIWYRLPTSMQDLKTTFGLHDLNCLWTIVTGLEVTNQNQNKNSLIADPWWWWWWYFWNLSPGTSQLLWIFYVFVLSCVCDVFVRVCLYVICGHLLGKGWPLGSRLWCLLWVCHFPIGILGQVWYLIVSIPDLCTLTYFPTPTIVEVFFLL